MCALLWVAQVSCFLRKVCPEKPVRHNAKMFPAGTTWHCAYLAGRGFFFEDALCGIKAFANIGTAVVQRRGLCRQF